MSAVFLSFELRTCSELLNVWNFETCRYFELENIFNLGFRLTVNF